MLVGQFTNVEPGFLKDAIVFCIGVLGALLLGKQIWGRREAQRIEQPVQVQEVAPYVTKKDCEREHRSIVDRVERLEAEMRVIRSKMDDDKDQLLQAGEERARRLHQRIDMVEAEIRAMPKMIVDLINGSKKI
jgi:hypothetical protein